MIFYNLPPAEAALSFAKNVVAARAALSDPDPRWTLRELRGCVRRYENRVIECARMQMLLIERGQA
jgi:hypothetical protein